MKHSSLQFLFIIYKIIRGEQNSVSFKKIKRFSDFFQPSDNIGNAIIIKNIVEQYKLKISLEFNEEPFIDLEYRRRGEEYSYLDDLIEDTIRESFDESQEAFSETNDEVINIRNYYKTYFNENIKIARENISIDWLFKFIQEAFQEKQKKVDILFHWILSSIQFDIYKSGNIQKIKEKLNSYLLNFTKDRISITAVANFYNYQNNKNRLIEILRKNYEKYGTSFSVNHSTQDNALSEFRFLDTLLAFELLEEYVTIASLYFKEKDLYCFLTINDKLIKQFEHESELSVNHDKTTSSKGVLTINNKPDEYKNILSLPLETKWSDVNIRWKNGNDVEITLNNDANFKKIIDYKELDFYDYKKKGPNMNWQILSSLAIYHGKMGWENIEKQGQRQLRAFQKRISELRKQLKVIFDLEGDPIETYPNEKEYIIKINLIPEKNSTKDNSKTLDDILTNDEHEIMKEISKKDLINDFNKNKGDFLGNY